MPPSRSGRAARWIQITAIASLLVAPPAAGIAGCSDEAGSPEVQLVVDGPTSSDRSVKVTTLDGARLRSSWVDLRPLDESDEQGWTVNIGAEEGAVWTQGPGSRSNGLSQPRSAVEFVLDERVRPGSYRLCMLVQKDSGADTEEQCAPVGVQG